MYSKTVTTSDVGTTIAMMEEVLNGDGSRSIVEEVLNGDGSRSIVAGVTVIN